MLGAAVNRSPEERLPRPRKLGSSPAVKRQQECRRAGRQHCAECVSMQERVWEERNREEGSWEIASSSMSSQKVQHGGPT